MNKPNHLTEDQWTEFYSKCFDILVEHGGYHSAYLDMERERFVSSCLKEEHPLTEWRFCGYFGMGGKFWRANRRVYINYYSEDHNPKLNNLRDSINKMLSDLQSEYLGKDMAIFGPPQKHAKHVKFLIDLQSDEDGTS